MSRRFWGAVMCVSLLTVAGGAAFVYKRMQDRATITTALQPISTNPAKEIDTAPAEEKPAPKTEHAASTLRNIQFVYINSSAKEVFIVGNFEGKEKPVKRLMERNRNKWTATLKLSPGTYEYSYLVNGRSVRDPYNKKTSNGKSLITVKPLQAH